MDSRGSFTTETRSQSAVRLLVAALQERGLAATIGRQGVVWVRGSAGELDADGEGGQGRGPGLRQEVQCAERPGEGLWWFWMWRDGPERSRPDLEPLCPCGDIETAVERITAVLAVSRR